MSPKQTRSQKKALAALDDSDRHDYIAAKLEDAREKSSSSSSSSPNIQSHHPPDSHNDVKTVNLSSCFFQGKKSLINDLKKPIISLDLSDNHIDTIILNSSGSQSINCSNHEQLQCVNANIKMLQHLSLQKNELTTFPDIYNLNNLISLNLSRNSIKSFPSDQSLTRLSSLNQLLLSFNKIEQISSSISCLSNLTELDLSHNCLMNIPDTSELFSLTKLTKLQLNDNYLREISCSGLLKLVNLKDGVKNGLNLKRNHLKKHPPQDVADKGITSIRDFCNKETELNSMSETTKAMRQRSITFKLFVLGHDGAGKTELVRNLHRQFSRSNFLYMPVPDLSESNSISSRTEKLSVYPSSDTSGIDTSHIKVEETRMRRSNTGTITSTNININIWHFKGRESYHPMHEIFFTTHVLYIITWKLPKRFDNIEEYIDHNIQYWIDLVQARAPGATILIVGTHADRLQPQEIESVLNLTYSRLDNNAQERINTLEQRIEKVHDPEIKRSLEQMITERRRWKREIVPVNCLEEVSLTIPFLSDTVSSSGSTITTSRRYTSGTDMDPNMTISEPTRQHSTGSNISSLSNESAYDSLKRYASLNTTPNTFRNRQLSNTPSPSLLTPPPSPTPSQQQQQQQQRQQFYEPNQSMLKLRNRILELATPTDENPHPFGILGYDIPDYYQDIRNMLIEIKRTDDYCTMDMMKRKLMENNDHVNISSEDSENINRLHNALSYLSSIGEIFWIQAESSESKFVSDKSFDISHLIFLRPRYLMEKISCFLQLDNWYDKLAVKDGIVLWKDILKVLSLESNITKSQTEVSNLIQESETIPANSSTIAAATTSTLETIVHISNDTNPVDIWVRPRTPSRDRLDSMLGLPTVTLAPNLSEISAYLRRLLEHYGFIIPILRPEQIANPRSSTSMSTNATTAMSVLTAETPQQSQSPIRDRLVSSTSYTSLGEDDMLHQQYLMPLLLHFNSDVDIELQSSTAMTSFKRCFRFEHFTPPGLLHKVLAKVYAYKPFGILKKTISKNSFWLQFKSLKVCVHMKTQNGFQRNIHPNNHVNSHSVRSSNVNISHSVNALEIDAYGFIFSSNDMLQILEILCDFVRAVLSDIPGLLPLVDQITFCPSCRSDMSKLNSTKSLIGEFKWHDLYELQRSLKNCDESSDLDLRAWRSRLCVCPADAHCLVQPEQLIHIPSTIKSKLEEIQKTDHIFEYLFEDMVAADSVFQPYVTGYIPENDHHNYNNNSNNSNSNDTGGVNRNIGQDVRKSVVKVGSIHPTDQELKIAIKESEISLKPAFLTDFIVDYLTRNQKKVAFEIQAINSGVLVDVYPDYENSSNFNHSSPSMATTTTVNAKVRNNMKPVVLTSEHFISKFDENDCHIGSAYDFTSLFLVGDETNWHYLAKLVIQGSEYACSDKKFWDICALEIISKIDPEYINPKLLRQCESTLVSVRVSRPNLSDSYRSDLSQSFLDPSSPIQSASTLVFKKGHTSTVAENQVVCLMGYPQVQGLSVDWGRVEKSDLNEILVNVVSDNGSSGGPLFDREGRVIGVLSKSFHHRKYSSFAPLRDIMDRVRNKLYDTCYKTVSL